MALTLVYSSLPLPCKVGVAVLSACRAPASRRSSGRVMMTMMLRLTCSLFLCCLYDLKNAGQCYNSFSCGLGRRVEMQRVHVRPGVVCIVCAGKGAELSSRESEEGERRVFESLPGLVAVDHTWSCSILFHAEKRVKENKSAGWCFFWGLCIFLLHFASLYKTRDSLPPNPKAGTFPHAATSSPRPRGSCTHTCTHTLSLPLLLPRKI